MLMGHFFFVSMFVISMIRFHEFNMENFMSCPLFKILFIVFLSYLLIGIFDFRKSMPLSIYRAIQAFMGSYFPFFIGWVSLNNENREYKHIGIIEGANGNYNVFFKVILPITLLMTFYGLITGFTHTNVVLDAVGLKDRFLMESNLDSFRAFRVTSTCVSSSVYGLVCGFLFLCSFFTIDNKNKLQLAALVLLIINLLLTATRAAIIPFVIGLMFFILLNKGLTGLLKYLTIGIISILIAFPLLPHSITGFIYQLFDSILDVILPGGTGGVKYGGSNIDAREMQIGAAMEFLKEKPLFGHGFGYYGEVLSKGKKHAQLLGMESYLCFMGVERGLVNFFTEIVFYISAFLFFFRNRFINALYANLGMALIAMFIPFLIFAWVGGCWFFFMPILGYLVKGIYLSKQDLDSL